MIILVKKGLYIVMALLPFQKVVNKIERQNMRGMEKIVEISLQVVFSRGQNLCLLEHFWGLKNSHS